MKTTIQGIYTYEEKEQEMIDYKIIPENTLDDIDTLSFFMVAILTDDEMSELRKISVCVSSDNKPPEWFMKCNGKLYYENEKLIK